MRCKRRGTHKGPSELLGSNRVETARDRHSTEASQSTSPSFEWEAVHAGLVDRFGLTGSSVDDVLYLALRAAARHPDGKFVFCGLEIKHAGPGRLTVSRANLQVGARYTALLLEGKERAPLA
jgi:hypothetical protein